MTILYNHHLAYQSRRPLGISHATTLSASMPHPGQLLGHHRSPTLSSPFKTLPSRLMELATEGNVFGRQANGTHHEDGGDRAGDNTDKAGNSSSFSAPPSSPIMIVDGWKEGDAFHTQHHTVSEISPAAFLPVLFILAALLSLGGYIWHRKRSKGNKQLRRLGRVFNVLEKVSLIDKERLSPAEEKLADEVREALIVSYCGFADYDSPFYQPTSRKASRPGWRVTSRKPMATMREMTPNEIVDRLSRLKQSQQRR